MLAQRQQLYNAQPSKAWQVPPVPLHTSPSSLPAHTLVLAQLKHLPQVAGSCPLKAGLSPSCENIETAGSAWQAGPSAASRAGGAETGTSAAKANPASSRHNKV